MVALMSPICNKDPRTRGLHPGDRVSAQPHSEQRKERPGPPYQRVKQNTDCQFPNTTLTSRVSEHIPCPHFSLDATILYKALIRLFLGLCSTSAMPSASMIGGM